MSAVKQSRKKKKRLSDEVAWMRAAKREKELKMSIPMTIV